MLAVQWDEPVTVACRSISFVEATVLTAVEVHQRLTLGELRAHLHLTPSGETRALKRLFKTGALTKEGDSISLAPEWRSTSAQLTAVEFKLCRWRDALAQALSYLRFANRSYVVLDAHQTQAHSDMVDLFETVGVGLCLLDGDLTTVVVDAATHTLISPDRWYALQYMASRKSSELPLNARVFSPVPERL